MKSQMMDAYNQSILREHLLPTSRQNTDPLNQYTAPMKRFLQEADK